MAQRGVNKAIILGRLGQDPEIRYIQDGTAVTTMNIATSETWKDKHGQTQERTEWHRVVAFGKLAEIISEYVHKGDQVYIEGQIRTRKWQDQSGQNRYTTEIVAREMQMLGSRNGNGGNAGQTRHTAPAQQPTANDYDGDIPF